MAYTALDKLRAVFYYIIDSMYSLQLPFDKYCSYTKIGELSIYASGKKDHPELSSCVINCNLDVIIIMSKVLLSTNQPTVILSLYVVCSLFQCDNICWAIGITETLLKQFLKFGS